jgi:hypothetical protein
MRNQGLLAAGRWTSTNSPIGQTTLEPAAIEPIAATPQTALD